MSGIGRFTERLGGNIRESMGADGPAGAGGPLPAGAPPGPSRYRGVTRPRDALTIGVDRIMPDPDQPRKEFDEGPLADLAGSLRARGQLQPIRVRWSPEADRWVIIAGERRYRAALRAGLGSLICVEVPGSPTPEEVLEEQLVENALREDLRPIEQARAYKALVDRRGCSIRQLAESLHVSHTAVSRALALLGLPEDLQGRVAGSHLTSMHSMDDYYVSKLLPLLAESGVAAIANPLINIVIQGRHDTYPKRRGMTRVPELRAHGVPCAFGHDCVMDPWYPLGSGDMLEVAHMAIHVAQMTGREAMRFAFEAVTANPARILGLDGYGLETGCRGDLVVLQARDPIEAIRLKATRLFVVRGGRVIAEAPRSVSALALEGRPTRVDPAAIP